MSAATKVRKFEHTWTCAGCGSVFDLELEIPQRELDRSVFPAKYIALEKIAIARTAAAEHARRGCSRPV